MSTRLAGRLSRLLNLVPYFVANPGISAADAAAELGVTPKQLLSDLNQLWMCGLPGYGPGDLIDLSISEESIGVTFTAGIDRPLRLTSIEATVLLMALRSIADMPGMVDPTAAHVAMTKIETAAGVAAARNRPAAAVTDEVPVEDPNAATVRAALGAGHALRLVYYSASRDAVSDRVVDPIRILAIDEHSYLQAWCRQAEAVRLFRIDRIYEATELDEPASPPADATGRGPRPGTVQRRSRATAGADAHRPDRDLDARPVPDDTRRAGFRRRGRGWHCRSDDAVRQRRMDGPIDPRVRFVRVRSGATGVGRGGAVASTLRAHGIRGARPDRSSRSVRVASRTPDSGG